jgi:anhydro-N-acetylmuramic acid kinase
MSGTSLDGVDFAYCKFILKKKNWEFSIETAQTFPYPKEWRNNLAKAHLLSGEAILELNSKYGKYIGQLCNQFIKQK